MKSILYISVSIFFNILIVSNSLNAQGFLKRNNYNQLLEPTEKVVHGVGQSVEAHRNYWNLMSEGQKPSVIMYYVGLKGISSGWSKGLKSEVLSYLPNFVIPQIGLFMTQDGNPSSHYEGNVAAGLMDTEIDALIEGLKTLACPVYLRIGYEFNGTAWNGYVPDTYKKAFVRITQKIRASGVEVATVWDASAGGDPDYMSFYPGDEVVDWWGINPFTVSELSSTQLKNFIQDADSHKKPCMFGESTPKNVGTLQGQTSWDKWFAPYFNLLRTNAGLKMFCYINWNWAEFPQWADWGDCRLEMNSIVSNNYNNEMKAPSYLHAFSEKDFRSNLNYVDNIAPSQITNLNFTDITKPLVWNPVQDPSGLSHYMIYIDDKLADYTLDTTFTLSKLYAGQRTNISVSAMDRAGNEGPKSEALEIQAPDEIEKLQNWNFEQGLQNWSGEVWGGAAVFGIEESSPISDKKSAYAKITSSSGTDWHIQLRQSLKIKKGFKYRITYQARASKNLVMKTWLQMDHAPYGIYSAANVNLTTQAKSFSQEVIATEDDQVFLEFALGASGIGEVWIDNVSLVENNPNGVSSIDETENLGSEKGRIYPNPIKSLLYIENQGLNGAFEVQIYDAKGIQRIASLMDSHKTSIDTRDLEKGLYLLRLIQDQKLVKTEKVVVE